MKGLCKALGMVLLPILLLNFYLYGCVYAAAKKTAAPQKSTATFDEWLATLGASDVQELRLAKAEQTPDVILARAALCLKSGNPAKVLELLDNKPPFQSPDQESRRLLCLARAKRSLGQVEPAADFYVQALRALPEDQAAALGAQETGLGDLLRTAWISTYWNSVLQQNAASDPYLEFAQDSAGKLHLTSPFWKNVADMLTRTPNGFTGEPHPLAKDFQLLTPATADRAAIMRVMGALALKQWSTADSFLKDVSAPEIKLFWQDVIFRLKAAAEGGLPDLALADTDSTALANAGYLKAAAFLRAVLPRLLPGDTPWTLALPATPDWQETQKAIDPAHAKEALAYLFRKAGVSTDKKDKAQLYTVSFAYALMAGDFARAKTDWSELDQGMAPLPLKIAGTLLFNLTPAQLTERVPTTTGVYHLLLPLCSAAGYELYPLAAAPLWVRLGVDDLPTALEVWPTDPLLNYAKSWNDWRKAPDAPAARRLTQAYPTSYQASEAFMFLAKQALNKQRQDVAEYLAGQCLEKEVPAEARSDYFRLLSAKLFHDGRSEDSLAAYRKYYAIFDLDAEAFERLKVVTLAVERGWWEFAEQVLRDIMTKEAELSPAVKAETLKRLGDVNAARGQTDAALEAYLNLAWSMPAETAANQALLQAAAIYQRKGFPAQAIALLRIAAANAPTADLKDEANYRLDLLDALPSKPAKSAKGGKAKPEAPKPVRAEVLYPF